MRILRIGMLYATVSVAAAQVPGMFPWWEAPLRNDLGLSDSQSEQISATLREMRPKMIQLRGAVESAESGLKQELDATQVDSLRVNDAIEKVVTARADLTRAVAQMSLKLRLVLTPAQWQELQKRRPRAGGRRMSPRSPGTGGPLRHQPVPDPSKPDGFNY